MCEGNFLKWMYSMKHFDLYMMRLMQNFFLNSNAPRFLDQLTEKFKEKEEETSDFENKNVVDSEFVMARMKYRKLFFQKCVLCLKNPSLVRQCGPQCSR